MTDFASMSSKEIKNELNSQKTHALSCIVLGFIAAVGGSINATPRGVDYLDKNLHYGYIALAVSLVLFIAGVVLTMRYCLNQKMAYEILSRDADNDTISDAEEEADEAAPTAQKGI